MSTPLAGPGPAILDEFWQLTCVPVCGNDSGADGFYSCTPTGESREPDEGWLGHVSCDACGFVYSTFGAPVGPLWPIGRRIWPGESDQQLVVELMAIDITLGYGEGDSGRLGEISDELDRRFGAGALDRTAGKVTGWKMTSIEAVLWASMEWADCFRWLTGEITLDNWENFQVPATGPVHGPERPPQWVITSEELVRCERTYTQEELGQLEVDQQVLDSYEGSEVPADALDPSGALHDDLAKHRDVVRTTTRIRRVAG